MKTVNFTYNPMLWGSQASYAAVLAHWQNLSRSELRGATRGGGDLPGCLSPGLRVLEGQSMQVDVPQNPGRMPRSPDKHGPSLLQQ